MFSNLLLLIKAQFKRRKPNDHTYLLFLSLYRQLNIIDSLNINYYLLLFNFFAYF